MKRLTYSLLLILLSGLVACGANQPAANSQPVHVVTKQIDPCSLVPKAQVEQILKARVTAAQESSLPNSKTILYATCGYANWGFSISVHFSLEIYKDVASTTAAFEYHKHMIIIVSQVVDGTPSPGDVHVTFQNISGLGDQAFLIFTPQFPALYVQKGDAILSIIASNSGQLVSQFEKLEQQLARFAVQNM